MIWFLIISLVAWYVLNQWIALTIFTVGVIIVYGIMPASKGLNEETLAKALKIIETHKEELSIRRNQLTTQLHYGMVDNKKWLEEIEIFVNNIIEPVTRKIDIASPNYDRVRQEIDRVTANYKDHEVKFSDQIAPK